MSRSGYSYDLSDNASYLWLGAVKSALSGKRGQKMLKELALALDEMEDKFLAAESLVNEDGDYCALGVLGRKRGIDLKSLDPDDYDSVAYEFQVSPTMIREIVEMNDNGIYEYEPADPKTGLVRVRIDPRTLGEKRWQFMRNWVKENILKEIE